jgi:phage terminase small subunit
MTNEDKPETTPIDGYDPGVHMVEHGLTLKQSMFVGWYLITMNGGKAARLAGYAKPYHVAAHVVLHSANVRKALDVEFAKRRLQPSEILDRLKTIAEADISDYLIVDPQFAEEHDGVFKLVADGRVLDGIWIDLKRAIKDGNTGAIKSYKRVKGETVIELHDKVRALELVGRHYRMFADVSVQSPKEDGTAEELDDAALTRIAKRAALEAEAAASNVLTDALADEPI